MPRLEPGQPEDAIALRGSDSRHPAERRTPTTQPGERNRDGQRRTILIRVARPEQEPIPGRVGPALAGALGRREGPLNTPTPTVYVCQQHQAPEYRAAKRSLT